MSQPAPQISPWKTLLQLFADTLRANCHLALKTVAAAFLFSATQAAFIILAGPMVRLLFSADHSQDFFKLGQFLPKMLVPWLPERVLGPIPFAYLIWGVPCTIIIVGILRSLSLHTLMLSQETLALKAANHIRLQLFSNIVRQSFSAIIERSPAEWMSLVMNDVMFLQRRFSDILKLLARDLISVFAAIVALSIIDWQATIILSLALIPIAMLTGLVGKKISLFTEESQKYLAQIASHVLDYRRRFQSIRAQGAEAVEIGRFSATNDQFFLMLKKSFIWRAAFAPGLELFGLCCFAAFLYAFTNSDRSFSQSPEFLLQFFVALGLIVKPLRNIGEQISRLQETKGAMNKSLSLLSHPHLTEPHKQDHSADLPFPLQIKKVSSPYFKAADLILKKGTSIAVVGRSGSGKTSLARCLSGLIPPREWKAAAPYQSVKANATLVSQHPFLFQGDIRSNLTYGIDQALIPTSEDLGKLMEEYDLMDLLSGSGLENLISGTETNLSGGQQQRMLVIRNILRNKSLIIFDEATSGLDAKNEAKILEKVTDKSLFGDKCILFITHKLADLEKFDEVWLFENGELTDKGTYLELKQNSQKFKNFIAAAQ